jgi:hypothetical protein
MCCSYFVELLTEAKRLRTRKIMQVRLGRG